MRDTTLIILAAGRGRRLRGLHEGVPKTLLPLPSGRPLLHEIIINAVTTGEISQVIVVTGYKAESIEESLSTLETAAGIRTINNPLFDVTGPLSSLWLARAEYPDSDIVIANGDTYYDTAAFSAVLSVDVQGIFLGMYALESLPPRLAADDDAIRLMMDGAHLVAVRKGLSPASGVSAGILLVRGATERSTFTRHLTSFMTDNGGSHAGMIWHEFIDTLAQQPGQVRGLLLPADTWFEVDTPEDFNALHHWQLSRSVVVHGQ